MTPKIGKLKQKIEDLKAKIAAELSSITVEDVLGEGTSTKPRTVRASSIPANELAGTRRSPLGTVNPKAERKPRADGLPAKLREWFKGHSSETFTADELVGELKIDPALTGYVRTTLSRMKRNREITSPTTGSYQAKGAA